MPPPWAFQSIGSTLYRREPTVWLRRPRLTRRARCAGARGQARRDDAGCDAWRCTGSRHEVGSGPAFSFSSSRLAPPARRGLHVADRALLDPPGPSWTAMANRLGRAPASTALGPWYARPIFCCPRSLALSLALRRQSPDVVAPTMSPSWIFRHPRHAPDGLRTKHDKHATVPVAPSSESHYQANHAVFAMAAAVSLPAQLCHQTADTSLTAVAALVRQRQTRPPDTARIIIQHVQEISPMRRRSPNAVMRHDRRPSPDSALPRARWQPR